MFDSLVWTQQSLEMWVLVEHIIKQLANLVDVSLTACKFARLSTEPLLFFLSLCPLLAFNICHQSLNLASLGEIASIEGLDSRVIKISK